MRKYISTVLILLLLSGCASTSSLNKDRSSMLSILENSEVCCSEIRGLNFKVIDELPYSSSNLSFATHELITQDSDIYIFDGFKSYVASFDIPGSGKKRLLRVNSRQITDTFGAYRGGFFLPTVRVYDSEFNELLVSSDFKFEEEGQNALKGAGVQGSVTVPENGKYVVIHTTGRDLSRYTVFGWTGKRTCNATNGVPRCGNKVSIPGIPEGALLISIELI